MLKRLSCFIFLAAVVTVSPGCSLFIAAAGIPHGVPETRELVHNQFGRPEKISKTTLLNRSTGERRGFDVEHYHVHAKFAPRYGGTGYYHPVMLFAEPITVPISLFVAATEIMTGHVLEFVYDDEGNTIGARYPLSLKGPPLSLEDRLYTKDWAEITADGRIADRGGTDLFDVHLPRRGVAESEADLPLAEHPPGSDLRPGETDPETEGSK